MTNSTCSLDDCERRVMARSWCRAHYLRWWKYGDPIGGAPLRDERVKLPVAERFWSKVNRNGPTAAHMETNCWQWTAYTNPKGYGIFHTYRPVMAHRFAYELVNGPIPAGMQIDHRCLNSACVNPAHLRLATNKQNAEHKCGARRDSKTGVRGVYWHKAAGRWIATAGHNGKIVHLGLFDTIEDADAAARAKRLELFTHNELDRLPEPAQVATMRQLELFDMAS
jgi:HNH endonuclease/AP2 domain